MANIPPGQLNALLGNPYESLTMAVAEDIVRFISSSNEGVYPVNIESSVGKHISEASPNTRQPRILETGKAEIGRSTVLGGNQRVHGNIHLLKQKKRRKITITEPSVKGRKKWNQWENDDAGCKIV